jgi:hypothetical protein
MLFDLIRGGGSIIPDPMLIDSQIALAALIKMGLK